MEMKTLTVNGKTYIVADPDAAHFDNSKPGDGAWSGKNTVDRLCPAFSENGSVVSCHPVEGYPLSVVSQIQPVQEGEGDPAPASWESHTTITGNGEVTLTITEEMEGCTFRVYDSVSNQPPTVRDPGYSEVGTANGKYVEFSIPTNNGWAEANVFILPYDASERETVFVVEKLNSGNIRPITGHSETKLWRNDEQFTAQLGQTVYGGSYNWQTGELVIDRKRITLDGSEAWTSGGSSTAGLSRYRLTKTNNPTLLDNVKLEVDTSTKDANLLCSKLPTISANAGWQGTDGIYAENASAINVFCRQYATDIDGFKEMMTGAQILFGLEAPITVQLTPQEILALSGENTLYSDTGDTTTKGRADPGALIQKITDAVIALGGKI